MPKAAYITNPVNQHPECDGGMLTPGENREDGVIVAQRTHCRLVCHFGDKVSSCQVMELAHEEVIDVIHHLSQQPIVCFISRCVDEIATNVGANGQR
jgi:hypothetical protein